MPTAIGRLALALALILGMAASALAQTEAKELRVATRVLSPLVVEQQGTLTGFSIALAFFTRSIGRPRR